MNGSLECWDYPVVRASSCIHTCIWGIGSLIANIKFLCLHLEDFWFIHSPILSFCFSTQVHFQVMFSLFFFSICRVCIARLLIKSVPPFLCPRVHDSGCTIPEIPDLLVQGDWLKWRVSWGITDVLLTQALDVVIFFTSCFTSLVYQRLVAVSEFSPRIQVWPKWCNPGNYVMVGGFLDRAQYWWTQRGCHKTNGQLGSQRVWLDCWAHSCTSA